MGKLSAEQLSELKSLLEQRKAEIEGRIDEVRDGQSRVDHARDIIKKITKKSFSYRTKNLILYMTQAVARAVGVERIYAVTNYGYYANNHMRSDRKLKTNFEDFWAEADGRPTEDKRFYELPLIEPRKTMEEVPTRKRAVYRKRFEFLDTVDAEIEANIKKILKPSAAPCPPLTREGDRAAVEGFANHAEHGETAK